MTSLTLARPVATPASSPVLDRIFTAAHSLSAANDTASSSASLIVRRRERQRRRDAR